MAVKADGSCREVLSDLGRELTCPICLCVMADPTRLNCCHYFCWDCLSQALKAERTRCPVCKEPSHRRDSTRDPTMAKICASFRKWGEDALANPGLLAGAPSQAPSQVQMLAPPPPPRPSRTPAAGTGGGAAAGDARAKRVSAAGARQAAKKARGSAGADDAADADADAAGEGDAGAGASDAQGREAVAEAVEELHAQPAAVPAVAKGASKHNASRQRGGGGRGGGGGAGTSEPAAATGAAAVEDEQGGENGQEEQEEHEEEQATAAAAAAPPAAPRATRGRASDGGRAGKAAAARASAPARGAAGARVAAALAAAAPAGTPAPLQARASSSAAAAATPRAPSASPATGGCPPGTAERDVGGSAQHRAGSAPPGTAERRIPGRLLPWLCPRCTLENTVAAKRCGACKLKRADVGAWSPETERQRQEQQQAEGTAAAGAAEPQAQQAAAAAAVDSTPAGKQTRQPRLNQMQTTASRGARAASASPAPGSAAGVCAWSGGTAGSSGWTLVGSGLDDADKAVLRKLCAASGARLLDKWPPGARGVTHVVCRTDENHKARRTIKYLMGLAAGAWVVDVAWASACVAAGGHADEGPHLVGGDAAGGSGGAAAARARAATAQPPLLAGYALYLHGSFPAKDEVQALIRAAGAASTAGAAAGVDPSRIATLVDGSCPVGPLADLALRRDRGGLKGYVLNTKWLLDSISAMCAQPMEPYYALLQIQPRLEDALL
ncbi:hypothetical protein FOA52_005770 [Chlamydomonas sp. UWO 241]|nr:hypothetical protein FOA52_005770 [Chlamydomonas sp. UWO 241]